MGKRVGSLLFVLITLLALPVSVFLVNQKTGFLTNALGEKANLLIDAGSSFNVPGEVWKNLAQGGEETGQMLSSVRGEVAALQPRYIRIDHVFDSYNLVSRDSSGSLSFNWVELDKTISDITSSGSKPFIALSYMPPAISSGGVTDLPVNWGDWQTAVQRMIEHISGKGGLAIGSVYYEVWNEPDLFGGFKANREKNYLELYRNTVVGAARAQNTLPFKIGGPATTNLYKNWFDSLLKMISAENLRLDFLSWHLYSKDLDDFENSSVRARTWLEAYPAFSNVELIISETGPNSENDPVYDGNFSAIHTLATTAVLEGNIAKSFQFEIKDGPGPEKFWGRWGILTHEKFGAVSVKPRYRSLQFLNRMAGNKVNVAGTGSWVKAFAKEQNGVVRVLVANYDKFGKHTEAVPVKFINLDPGAYTFRRIDFLGGTKELRVTIDGTGEILRTELFNPNSAAIFEIASIQ